MNRLNDEYYRLTAAIDQEPAIRMFAEEPEEERDPDLPILHEDEWWLEVYYPDLAALGDIQAGVNALLHVNEETGELYCEVGFLGIPDVAQNYRLGEKVMTEFARHCIEIGVSAIHSAILNPFALRIRKRVFGEEAMQMYDEENNRLTYDEALAYLNLPGAASVFVVIDVDDIRPEVA